KLKRKQQPIFIIDKAVINCPHGRILVGKIILNRGIRTYIGNITCLYVPIPGPAQDSSVIPSDIPCIFKRFYLIRTVKPISLRYLKRQRLGFIPLSGIAGCENEQN